MVLVAHRLSRRAGYIKKGFKTSLLVGIVLHLKIALGRIVILTILTILVLLI